MMRGWQWALLALLLAGWSQGVLASKEGQVWQANGSGVIDIAADGSVSAFSPGQSLGSEVDALIRTQVEAWRFEPVIEAGVAIPVRARVDLTLQAVPTLRDAMEVRVSKAKFFELVGPKGGEGGTVASPTAQLQPPAFPVRLSKAGVMGTVVMILDVSRDGRVVEAQVERLDILSGGYLTAGESRKHAGDLEKAVRHVLPNWTFPPGQLDYAGREVAQIRVPVAFAFRDSNWMRLYPVAQSKVRIFASQDPVPVADFGADGSMASPRIALTTRLEPLSDG